MLLKVSQRNFGTFSCSVLLDGEKIGLRSVFLQLVAVTPRIVWYNKHIDRIGVFVFLRRPQSKLDDVWKRKVGTRICGLC